MKNKIILIIIVQIMSFNVSYPWGEEGHHLINKKAAAFLPKEMSSFRLRADSIAAHASDADNRKDADKSEFPKHFIDIDYYKEFLSGNMIENKDQLISTYNDSIVTKMGLLPWATIDALHNLTKAFKEKDDKKILLYASDLGHYVGDGHQPMHSMVNYNGQLTGQKGLHAKYEIDMVKRYLTEIDSSVVVPDVKYVNNPLDFIFTYIADANSVSGVLLDADKLASNIAGKRDGDEYYKVLWFRTGYVTKIQFNNAVKDLASLYYTAWVDAGKPSLN